MLILTIETCTDMSTLGLVKNGAVLASAEFPSRHTLAKGIISRIDWLLTDAGLKKTDIEAIALSIGPGSFTGVRIGAAAAKMLAWGLNIPLAAVSTLEAINYPYSDFKSALLAPIINARRQQVYTALFHHGTRLTEDKLLSADDFHNLIADNNEAGAETIIVGLTDGLPEQFITDNYIAVRALATPHSLAAIAEIKIAAGDTADPMTATPIYLRAAADR